MTLSIDTDLITIDKIQLFANQQVETDMLRLDKIHAQISGNKWFKLKYYLAQAIRENKSGLISLGGPWSNHLLALAAATREAGLKSIGIIRGEKPAHPGDTLGDLSNLGMELIYTSRSAYRNREQLLSELEQQYPDFMVVDEGGQGPTGARGASEILQLVPDSPNYSHILCAVGTGTMLAGLALAAHPQQQLIGISSLKGKDEQLSVIEQWFPQLTNRLEINTAFHFGGFARHTTELTSFMNHFFEQTGVPTDIVYTAKLCYAWQSLAREGFFEPGSRVLLIHSGGLQGNRSLAPGTLTF
jgi:1-aminocyclopropane-1-carboxylate deaminase/D-cysteine desulfhydrase-like pyridoxal-dependent ACC family enzyme